MTVRVALIWLAVGVCAVVAALGVGAAADSAFDRPCNPSGTLVESTGLVIRDHSSSLCQPGGTGG